MSEDSEVGICAECKVRDGDSTDKKLCKCPYCERWFCEKHLNPRPAIIRSLDSVGVSKLIEKARGIEGGHPDFAYSKIFAGELAEEEEERSRRMDEALDRLSVHSHAGPARGGSEKPYTQEPRKSTSPFKTILALLLVAVIIGAIIWTAPSILSILQKNNHSSDVPITIPPNQTSPPTYNRTELVNYALSLINSDRTRSGLSSVTLSLIDSAQQHADSMLAHGYFSHWDTNGYKPHMRYTLAGGQGSVSENIACLYSSGSVDLKATIRDLEYQMMYDDASSAWGHKHNILTPFHNRVSIGIAFDDHNLYFVEDFENDYVDWSTLTASNGEVVMAGNLEKSGLSIQHVAIYYDNPVSLTAQQLKNPPYSGSYDAGTYVGMALPSGWESVGGITITAGTWFQTGQSFQIGFDLSPAFTVHGKGVYTLCLQSNLENTLEEDNSLTSYSIWYSG